MKAAFRRAFEGYLVAAVIAASTVAHAGPLVTVGANFAGSNSNISGSIPPDTDGAVGPGQIVELLNGIYQVYDKTGLVLQTSSLDQFWAAAGTSATGFSYDPRVLYDPFSQRWFASAIDFSNSFLLAVSRSADPTAGWTGFKIPPGGDTSLDFDTLGINKDGAYLYASSAMVVVPKSDLLTASPTIGNATILKSGEFGFGNPNGGKAQPVVTLDNTGLPEALLNPLDETTFKRSNVTGTITSPALDTSGGLISVAPFGGGPGNVGAQQPNSAVTLATNALDFTSSVILRNGVIWGVEGVNNQGRFALRWFAIDANTNVLLQEGLIADPNQDIYMGSIAVNEFGDVVIGFNESSTSQFASSYAVAGTTVDGSTTFGEPMILKAGIAPFELTGGAIMARWGDYSATVVDPTDSLSFWTFQEWTSGENVWSTEISEIIFGTQVAMAEPSSLLVLGMGLVGLALHSVLIPKFRSN